MSNSIFEAAEEGNISKLRSAIINGAKLNSVNGLGETALIIACKLGHVELVKFILSRGAPIALADNKNMSAIKYAEISKNTEILNILKSHLPDETIDDNSRFEEHFINIENNLFPVLKQIEYIIKDFNEQQKGIIKGDLLRILLLFRNEEKPSLFDGYGFGLSLLIIYEVENYLERFTNIQNLPLNRKLNFAEEILDGEMANIKNKKINFENFSLRTLEIENLCHDNADKIKKAFYEYAEIIVKADGIVTEEESNTLKLLSETFYKEQKKEAKPIQAKEFSKTELDSILEELNNLVGMDNIKQDISSLINIIKINKLRSIEGLPEQKLSLHSVFIGPPGTGKTTIARILSNIYNSLEILPKSNFVETDRSGLVAGYVGQTAIKTDDIINQALNGVLFIDEAYTLKRNNSDDDYGQEAIDILLKRMEDNRGNLIIIVAGYEEEMLHFINSNPGLKSRFNRYFHFKDYDSVQLTEIFKRIADKAGFIIKEQALKRIQELFEILYNKKDNRFGNARLARNIFEKTFEKHANRTALIAPITRELLTTIEDIDIPFNEFINQN